MKRNLKEFGVVGAVLPALFLTGLHTEVFGLLQRGVPATGIMKSDVNDRQLLNILASTPAICRQRVYSAEGKMFGKIAT